MLTYLSLLKGQLLSWAVGFVFGELLEVGFNANGWLLSDMSVYRHAMQQQMSDISQTQLLVRTEECAPKAEHRVLI